jgi:hypothetical protein
VAELCDEALATAKSLDEEASSLHASNAERSQQLQGEAGLFKSATAAQECVCTIAAALD